MLDSRHAASNLSKAFTATRLLLKGRPDYVIYKASPRLFQIALAMLGYAADERYSRMQKTFYEGLATLSPEAVVGFFEAHEQFPYEEFLLCKITGDDSRSKLALDFGCGMGRMVKRMAPHFQRVDGVDIAKPNIEAAKKYTDSLPRRPLFYVNNGRDLSDIPSAAYQFVYSTIAMQHIPVHSIRMNLFREFHRILGEGQIAIQMVYSASSERARIRQKDFGDRFRNITFSEWEDDFYEAKSTNGANDVIITDRTVSKAISDIARLGFRDVEVAFSEPPHETIYDKWIYIYGSKRS